MPSAQEIDQALLRLVIDQLFTTKRTLKLLTDILMHDLTPEQYAAAVEEPGLLRVLAQMDKDIEHLMYHELTEGGVIQLPRLAWLCSDVNELARKLCAS